MPPARWGRSTRYSRALARSTNQRMNAIFRSIIGMSVATVAFIMLFLSDQGTRTPEAADDGEEYYFGLEPTVASNLFYKIIREGARGDELSAEVIIPDTVQSSNKNEEPNFYDDPSPKKMAYIDKKLRQAFEISGIKEEVNDADIKIGKIIERRKERLKKKSEKGFQNHKTVENKDRVRSSNSSTNATHSSRSVSLKNFGNNRNVKSLVHKDSRDITTNGKSKVRKPKTEDSTQYVVIKGFSLYKAKTNTYLNTSDTPRTGIHNKTTLLNTSNNIHYNNTNDKIHNSNINDINNNNDDNNNNNNNNNDNNNNNNNNNDNNNRILNHTSGLIKHSLNLIENVTEDGTTSTEKNKTIKGIMQGSTVGGKDDKKITTVENELKTQGTSEDTHPGSAVSRMATLSSTADAIDLQVESTPRPKKDGPLIYVITPTYKRPEQLAELTRLSQTLMHVRKLHWLVVEDAISPSAQVITFLRECVVPHTYLLGRAVKKFRGVGQARGVSNRNSALKWITKKGIRNAVFYFADDDNTYDYRIFDEIRKTRQVSMFPVGLVTKFGVSSPIVRNGKVIGFYDGWIAGRKFPVDMAGFAVNVKYYLQQGAPLMPYTVGYEEDGFLQNLHIQPKDIEPLANNCTKVLVWHTRTIKNALAQPMPSSDKVRSTNLEKLKAHLLFQPSWMP